MSQIKLTRSAHGEHMMCTRVYTLVQTSLYLKAITDFFNFHFKVSVFFDQVAQYMDIIVS